MTHQRAEIERVAYSHGELQIHVSILLVDDTGRIVGAEPVQEVRAKEPDGAWTNEDVIEILRREQVLVSRPAPPVAEVLEVRAVGTNELIRQGLPGIPAREAIWRPMFRDDVEFVWK